MDDGAFGENYFKNYKGGNYPSKKLITEIIKNLPPGSKVLDVGCGKGEVLRYIKKIRKDLDLYGVDIADVKKYLPKEIKFKRSSGDSLPFNSDSFDFIICTHVLEHIERPHRFIKEFYRILKKGGKVYIEMPYYKTTFIPEGNMNFWSDPTHIRPYNEVSVKRLLEENGFKVLKIKVWRDFKSIILGPYLIIKRILLKDKNALSTFFAHLVGNSIGGLGVK